MLMQDSLTKSKRTDLMSASHVALLLEVDSETVHEWAATGKLIAVQDKADNHMFLASSVLRLLNADL